MSAANGRATSRSRAQDRCFSIRSRQGLSRAPFHVSLCWSLDRKNASLAATSRCPSYPDESNYIFIKSYILFITSLKNTKPLTNVCETITVVSIAKSIMTTTINTFGVIDFIFLIRFSSLKSPPSWACLLFVPGLLKNFRSLFFIWICQIIVYLRNSYLYKSVIF